MSQNMKLEVILSAINKATAPLKAITKGSSETAKALKAARDNLKALNAQQNDINGFRKLDKDIAISNNALKGATEHIKRLKLEMSATEKPTAAMTRAFNKAVTEAGKLKQQHGDLLVKQQQLRTSLQTAGMDTKKLAEHQRTLKTNLASATDQVNRQTEALKKQNDIANRMQAAKQARDQALQRRNAIAGAGASTMAAGVAMGAPVLKTVKDYAEFETAMLGVAKQVNGARDANGAYTQTYYEMSAAIKDMSERLPLTAIEIAQLVEGAARMGIQGKENLLTFTEQAAIMAAAFDLPTDQIAEDMGMISGLFKIPIKDISEFGDSINYIDDNAQSKVGDIINVLKRIAGTTQMVGMSYKDAAALGSTFLSLGSGEEVAATATNAMIGQLANAPILSSSARYADGLKMLGLEAVKLQKAMNSDATGTILDVLDRIKALPKDKQLEAATRLFGKEYGDDASKLAQNVEEYRRQLELTKDAQAKGSMGRESAAQLKSLNAQYDMAANSLSNISTELGQQLKPALVDVIVMIKDMAASIRDWVKEHPVLTGYLLKAAAALSIITIGVGGLLLAIAGIMGPIIALRFGLSFLGINGGILIPILRGVGTAVMFIGRMLLLNPIGLAVTAIATAAFLIYKYWDPIKTFFSNLWDSVTNKFKIVVETFKSVWAPLTDWFGNLWKGITNKIANFIKWHIDKILLISDLLGFDIGNNSGIAIAGAGDGISGSIVKSAYPLKPHKVTNAQAITHAPVINVHAAPGMNEKQVADAVAKELEKSNHTAAARNRSLLRDRE